MNLPKRRLWSRSLHVKGKWHLVRERNDSIGYSAGYCGTSLSRSAFGAPRHVKKVWRPPKPTCPVCAQRMGRPGPWA